MAEKEYIERGKLIGEMQDCKYAEPSNDFQRGVNSSVDILIAGFKHLPAADVAEVRHGAWKKVYDKAPQYVCTNCNHLFNNKSYKYCPNCGAKMDGERKADNE